MLAFDLPDYSKSSTAQNEKLAKERERRRGSSRGRLSAKPNSSPFASCFQEIWKRHNQDGVQRGSREKESIQKICRILRLKSEFKTLSQESEIESPGYVYSALIRSFCNDVSISSAPL